VTVAARVPEVSCSTVIVAPETGAPFLSVTKPLIAEVVTPWPKTEDASVRLSAMIAETIPAKRIPARRSAGSLKRSDPNTTYPPVLSRAGETL